jgi:hypothetical protein
MEPTYPEVSRLAERLHKYFADHDRNDEFRYISWERLSEPRSHGVTFLCPNGEANGPNTADRRQRFQPIRQIQD